MTGPRLTGDGGVTGPVSGDAIPDGLDNLLFDVWLVSRATTAAIDAAIETSGLDADEFAIYSVLASGDGMTPTALAHWMAAPATTVSSYIKRFERRGHIERVPHPVDRRSYQVRLTREGRTAHATAGNLFRPVLDAVAHRMGSELSDTQARLVALHRIVTALGADGINETVGRV